MTSKIVQSGAEPQGIRILADKVLVTEDAHEITVPDIDGEDVMMYEYTQVEYSKNEYIGYLREKVAENAAQTTDIELALVELYEEVML